MAQKVYVGGNSNLAQNVKDIYVGVNGVARKVVKGYVGVNGVARQFWGASSSSKDSWDYWTSVSNFSYFFDRLFKVNNKIAYYATIKVRDTYDNTRWYYPLIMSPDPDAVTSRYYVGTPTPYNKTIIDTYDSTLTWYVLGCHIAGYSIYSFPAPDDLLNDDFYTYNRSIENLYDTVLIQAAQDLLDKIYATPFHENYQVGNYYTFNLCNKEKFLRKCFGIYLFRNIEYASNNSQFNVSYMALSNNVNTIISEILLYLQSINNIDNKFILFNLGADYYLHSFRVTIYYPNNYIITPYFRVSNKSNLYFWYLQLSCSMGSLNNYVVNIDSNGTITYSDTGTSGSISSIFSGIYIRKDSYYNYIQSTSIGLDL